MLLELRTQYWDEERVYDIANGVHGQGAKKKKSGTGKWNMEKCLRKVRRMSSKIYLY